MEEHLAEALLKAITIHDGREGAITSLSDLARRYHRSGTFSWVGARPAACLASKRVPVDTRKSSDRKGLLSKPTFAIRLRHREWLNLPQGGH